MKKTSKSLSAIRKQPGMSNAGKYSNVKKFAGPNGTFPINTIERGKSALKLAHNAPNPSAIKAKVYAAYPSLKPPSPQQPTMRRQREVARRSARGR